MPNHPWLIRVLLRAFAGFVAPDNALVGLPMLVNVPLPANLDAGLKRWSKLAQVALALLMLGLAAPGVVAADAARRAGEPAGYRPLITEAVAEYDAGNFAEARSLFDKANAMYSTARALRGLGMVEFELRNYSDSINFLERALASKVQPLDGALRAETEQLLARARGFIAQLDLAIEPGGSTVIVDGTPVSLGPQGRLVLEVGDHVLEFSAQGYQPEKRVMKIKGGEQQVLRIVLPMQRAAGDAPGLRVQSLAQPATGPLAQNHVDSGEPAKKPLYKNPWLWTGVGIAVVALAVGLGVGLTRNDPGTREPVKPAGAAVVVGP